MSQAERAKLETSTSKERKQLSAKQVGGLLMAGMAVFATLGTGCSAKSVETPRTPGIETPDTEVKVPKEAQAFVDLLGDRYQDPVSTYYSEIAYEKKYDQTLLITDENADKWEITGKLDGETSHLGFHILTIPFDTEFNSDFSAKFFNESVVPNLDKYMNLVAKNPYDKPSEIIESEFQTYIGGADNIEPNYQEYGRNIAKTLRGVVEKYGPNAIYSIAPAKVVKITDSHEPYTQFDSDVPPMLFDKNMGYSDGGILLMVNIDVYDGKKVTRQYEVIDGFQYSVRHLSPYVNNVSFGENNNK